MDEKNTLENSGGIQLPNNAVLQNSAHLLNSFAAYAPVGIYLTDIDGHCRYANKSGWKWLG